MKIKLWNHSQIIKIHDKKILIPLFHKILLNSGFKVLDYIEYNFSPVGFTAVWLLAESHFAIHSFPEEGGSYIEISSCNLDKQYKFLKALEDENMYYK